MILAFSSFESNGWLCRVRRWRVPGSARLSVFSAPGQGATGEAVAEAAGRKAIRASAVCPKSSGIGSKSVASVIEKPRPREENAESYWLRFL